jgi:hypothetical protein
VRGLSGDFGTMPLKDLVVFLGNRKASGTLSLHRQAVHKTITLHEGFVVNASSNQTREYLGQFLINMGLITEEQFNKAYETQQETRIFLGKILAMIGLVTEEQVGEALKLKFRETLLAALEWTEGEFGFTPQDEGAQLQGVEQQVDLLDVAREAEFRETAWQAIRAAFPAGDLKLTVHRENLPEIPKPGSLDDKIATMIDDGLTIDEMVLAMHAIDFVVYQRLYALYRLDAVRVRAADEAPAPKKLLVPTAVEPTPEEIANTAELMLESGNHRDAADLARRAFELSNKPGHKALFERANQAYLSELKAELLANDCVPALNVAQADLKRMPLSAPQKYLLSRIDGARSLKAIVQVSPIPELEALKAFREFVESNLVRLEKKAA